MEIRLLLALVGLAMSFALPTLAQQKDAPDPELRQMINPSFAVSSQILCLLIFCRLILKGLRSKKLGYGVCTDLTSFRSQ